MSTNERAVRNLPRNAVRPCLAVVSAFLAGAAAGAAGQSGAAAAAPRPNIILIMSDDMGFSDLGCYGGEIETPVLDGLAKDGLRFTQFYNTARCCPTRASLMTGLYPHQASMGHMTTASKDVPEPYAGELNRRAATIAEVLQGAGYGTYMCGKWHVTKTEKAGNRAGDNWPRQRGFDRFYGTITGAGSFYDPTTLTRDNTMITPENDPEYRPARFYYTDAISDQAARFIREHKDRKPGAPFFLYVAYTAAHWPMHAPEEAIARYRGRYDAGYGPVRARRFERVKELGLVDPAWGLTPASGSWDAMPHKAWEARNMEVYAAMISIMDAGIGRIVAQLKTDGILDHTLILFLQDNGGCAEGMGRDEPRAWAELKPRAPMAPDEPQPSIWPPMHARDGRPLRGGPQTMAGPADTYLGYGREWANVSNTPFREFKHWVHEGGISTPLIAFWPAGIARRGAFEHQPGHLVDIMATCVDLAKAVYPAERDGAPVPPMEGVSLAPAFRGEPLARKNPLFWEHEGNRALRDGRWKLVAKGPAGPWELYDMEKDRTEMHDLAAAQPERVKAMAERWETMARAQGVLPWIWKPAYGEKPSPAKSRGITADGRTVFDLKAGETLTRDTAPDVGGRPFRVEAEIVKRGDGIILAQGGRSFGYALLVREGRPVFQVRNRGRLYAATATEPLPAGACRVAASLAADGRMVVAVDGREAASAAAEGPLAQTPADGLDAGFDGRHEVGDYQGEFRFGGELGRLKVMVEGAGARAEPRP